MSEKPDRNLEGLAGLIETGDENSFEEIAMLLGMKDDQHGLSEARLMDMQPAPSVGFLRRWAARFWKTKPL